MTEELPPEDKKEIEKPKNIYKILTIIFAILLIITIIKPFSGGISEGEAKTKALTHINSILQGRAIADVVSIEDKDDLYKIDININGEVIESYMTKDGSLLFPSAMDLTQPVQTITGSTTQKQEDWDIFEKIPTDIRSQILSFKNEQPEIYEGKILEFKNYELIPNSLIVFYSPGCGWCKEYYTVLLEAKEKYPETAIYALDLINSQDMANKYSITGTPASVINGKYLVSGYMPIEDLTETLNKLE